MDGSRKRRVLHAAAGLLALTGATHARADEPLFGYVNTTDLLPKGKFQIEQWLTAREGGGPGRYQRLEGRSAVEYGLRDDLQLTAYLNYSRLRAELDRTGAEAAGVLPAPPTARSGVDGVTGEAIWRVASPYLSPIGIALLVDATVGRERPVFGFKAIAQKNMLDDTLVFAGNARLDLGQVDLQPQRNGPSPRRRDVSRLEFDLGASYRFRANWSAALELRYRKRYAGGRLQDTAAFFGPSLHYGGQRWFFTLSALRRLHDAHRSQPAGELSDSLTYLAERTEWDGLRLRVGRTF